MVLIGAIAGFGMAALLLPEGAAPPSAPTRPAVGLPPGSSRPDFSLPDLDGVLRQASEWDGKVLVINFWAAWCPPCLREIPYLVALQDRYGARGVQVIGVALDDPEPAGELARALGINYPVLAGDADAIAAAVRFGNGQGLLPYTVIVDRGGRVALSHLGEITPDLLDSAVLPLLEPG